MQKRSFSRSLSKIRYAGIYSGVTAVSVALLSCTVALSPEKYLERFGTHKQNYCTKITRNGVTARVTCLPREFFAARDMLINRTIGADSALARYRNSFFIALGISQDTATRPGSFLLTRNGYPGFKENVLRNNFARDRDIFLIGKSDTIKPLGVLFDRDWGMMNEDVFLVTFPGKEIRSPKNEYRLIIREMAPELGTLDIELRKLKRYNGYTIKG